MESTAVVILWEMLGAVSRFGPPLALMGLIFYLSDQPDLSSGLGGWDLPLRKAAHMVEYGLLALLWWRALGTRSPWPAVVIAIAYAITDEVHQSYVEGRHGAWYDVTIDGAGAVLAVVLLRASRARSR